MANWALIGASRIAEGHMIKAIRSVPGHEIVSVLSAHQARGREFAARNGIAHSTTDLDTVLSDSDIDVVYVSTTNDLHFSQAMAAIEAGKHVLCEKPLAMTLDDAVQMVRAAEARGVVLATNHHLRNAGSHLAIRDLVARGRIGRVLSARVFHAVHLPEALQGWRIDNPAAGGGAILDITVHDADTIRFHLGEDPAEAVAISASSGMGQGVEDSVMSVWSMPSGATVFAHESFTHRFAGTGIELHGTEGSIVARNVMTQRPVGEVRLQDPEGRRVVPFSDHNLYVRGVSAFAEALNGQGAPAASGVDGVKSLAVALAVREAAQSGRRIAIGYGGL